MVGPSLEPHAGLSTVIGYPDDPPLSCGTAISDEIAGITAAFAVMAALHYRDMTGKGQHIDLSEVETMLSCMGEAIMEFTMNNRLPARLGNKDEAMAPHGVYKCQGKDKWVAIAVTDDAEWRAFCKVIGKERLIRDERFQDGFGRLNNQKTLDEIITQWTLNKKPSDIMNKLQKAGVACGPCYDAEKIFSDPHLRANRFFIEIEHPQAGKKEQPGVFARFSRTACRVRRHAPLLGEHTDEIRNLVERGK